MRPDARPQARKNRRRIRWNTLRIFSGRERRRWSRILRRSRKVNVGQAPKPHAFAQGNDSSILFLPGGQYSGLEFSLIHLSVITYSEIQT
jgi:hypothetical protein